jgi:hypothetical protein
MMRWSQEEEQPRGQTEKGGTEVVKLEEEEKK